MGGLVARLERAPVPRVFGLRRETSILFWAWFLWGTGAGLWSYFWPVYLARLGAGPVEVGLVVGTASLMATLVYLPGGFVAQLGHHKWQLVGAHTLVTLATTSFGLAQVWWHVMPGVLASNLVALFSPAINSLIAQAADEDDVPIPTIFTLIGAAQFTTMTISPPLGGWIADRLGMQALFPITGLCYAASVCTMAMMRSKPAPAAGAPDPAATRRSAWAAGAGAYREVLANARVRALVLTALLVYVGIHLGLSFAPLYLREVYRYDSAQIGWAGSAASAGAALLLLAIERLRKRAGVTRAMIASCALIALHLGCTLLSPILPVQLAGFFFRGGVQTAATLTTVTLTELVPRSLVAPGIAVFATVSGLAAIAAPPLGGWLYARAPAAPFGAGVLILALAIPLVTRAYRVPAPQPARSA